MLDKLLVCESYLSSVLVGQTVTYRDIQYCIGWESRDASHAEWLMTKVHFFLEIDFTSMLSKERVKWRVW